VKPSAVETVRSVIQAQAAHWRCLQQYGQLLPEDLAGPVGKVPEEAAQGQETAGGEEGEGLERAFRRMELEQQEPVAEAIPASSL
jgi:hypothetical protein